MVDTFSRLSLFEPVARSDALYFVCAQATYYPHFIRIYIPKKSYPNITSGLEPIDDKPKPPGASLFPPETDLERSLRKTRKTLKDYVFCNEFNLFVTLTIREDRQNIERSKRKVAGWLKNQRNRTGKFDYLIVPEFHKDSQSLHFHGLFNGFNGQLKQSINLKTGKPIKQGGREVFELPSYTLGFTNVKKIDTSQGSQTKVGFYLQKYITKDMPVMFGQNRYWNSRGLKTPLVEDNPEEWYLHVKPDRKYEIERGVIVEFDVDKHPLTALFHKAKPDVV